MHEALRNYGRSASSALNNNAPGTSSYRLRKRVIVIDPLVI
jgi:hypothetical protein